METGDTYRFAYQEIAFAAWRPNWPESFAIAALRQAGITRRANGTWEGTANGGPPVVASLGSGTGADAALFKKLGCRVICVDPSKAFLQISKQNLDKINEGTAEFILGNAMETFIPPGTVDVIVVAQALHGFKQAYSEQFIPEERKNSGVGTEELARQHWELLLRDAHAARLSVWYYNPDPRESLTQGLHDILTQHCPKYATSKTPLLNAAFFDPNHFQPWMDAYEMRFSELMPVQKVRLTREGIGDWLRSYSFKPDDADMDRVVTKLQDEWFDKYAKSDVLEIPYVGVITQAPLRRHPFPMASIEAPIEVSSPLRVITEERPGTAAHRKGRPLAYGPADE